MLSTMQDGPLLISGILRHGQQVYGASRVVTVVGPGGEAVEASFGDVARRSEQLAKALGRLGIGDSDRVGTFLWNNQAHLEAYLAVPSMGAVLHTLNIRLFPEQLSYVVNHAEDQVIIVDATLVPLLARVFDQLTTVRHVIVAGGNYFAIAAWLLMIICYLPMVRFYKLNPFWALTLPLTACFYLAATVHSAVSYWRGRGGVWKGRTQDSLH